MESFHILGICGILSISRALAVSSPTYLISAPRVLQPGVPLSVSVTVLTASPMRMTFALVTSNTTVVQAEGTFLGGSTGLQVLPSIQNGPISDLYPYMLVVKGYAENKTIFTKTTVLDFLPKVSSTFIQTDKSSYQPGQAVKIRFLSVYPDGKPTKHKFDVVIKDPRGNMILQWPSLVSFLGVVSREFQLSENPPLGLWTIKASAGDALSEKQFMVDYYVLPRFEVWVKAPSVIHREENLTGTVSALYMYGKPVRGWVSITARSEHLGMNRSLNMEMDGSANFVFRKEDLNQSQFNSSRSLDQDQLTVHITASVTELLTGTKYEATQEVTVVGSRYHLKFYGYPRILKPFLNFSAQLRISMYNGAPLTLLDVGKNVTLTVTQNSWRWMAEDRLFSDAQTFNSSLADPSDQSLLLPDPENSIQKTRREAPLPADGVVHVWFQLLSGVSSLTIQAEFQDSSQTLQLYSSYVSPSNSYLQISQGSSPTQVGTPLQLVVRSSFPLKEFHYLVMSQGQVVEAGTKASGSFTVTPRESWSPLACFLVYVVHADGEVANDVLRVPITQALRNHVSLSWSQVTVKPGGQLSLQVSVSEPMSLVGILVVDKATRRTDSNNDSTQKKLPEELAEYSMDKTDRPYEDMWLDDPYSIFTACNLVVLTDSSLSEAQTFWNPVLRDATASVTQSEPQSLDPTVRKDFPETWLWLDTNMSVSTNTRLYLTAPDSITSWIASAFVISENLGLGFTDVPAQLVVFQEFFLSLNIPPYIVRGEQLLLDVHLFNYLQQELEVMVIVAESASFEFIFPDNEGVLMASVRRVMVGSQDSVSVLFPIRPRVLGEMTVSVKAISYVASDAIVKKILVKPEGVEQSFTKSLFLELAPSKSNLTQEVRFTFPPGVVQGSESAHVTVVGDILGPSITGLEVLIQMPSGCGEQNMIHFAPNIYVLQYLTKTNQSRQSIRGKAVSFMLEGYQRELTYQRQDGSFSAFGDSDPSGSTWLSAFVLRCFLQSGPFIAVDPVVLSRAAAWLVQQQEPDGSFGEPGRVIHTELQGGLDGPISLTAYVLLGLLEDQTFTNMYSSQVSAALAFVEAKLSAGISSNYSLCLVAYALSLADSPIAERALTELLRRADVKDGVPSWTSSVLALADSWQPRSVDIEMAAYTLLSMFQQAKVVEGLALMKWLCQQRSHLGGFGSTQDTIIALQALSAYGALSGSASISLKIDVTTKPSGDVTTFRIDSNNYLLYQTKQIKAEKVIDLEVSMEGRGFIIFQLNVFYSLNSSATPVSRSTTDLEGFSLGVRVTAKGDQMDRFSLTVCTRLLENQGILQTGMVMMEVGLLSGFSLSENGIQTGDLIRRVETPPGKVVLYLDSLRPALDSQEVVKAFGPIHGTAEVTRSEVCIEIPTVRTFKVAYVQDSVVLVFDYYEPRRRAVRTYNSPALRALSPCSFCGSDCRQCRARGTPASQGVPSHNPPAALPCVLLSLLLGRWSRAD